MIGEAWNLLQYGDETVALVGGTDSMLNPLGVGGFSLLRVLSGEHDAPQSACRPFDASRKGTVLGEGSAFLVLESREHAVDRGANIYAEILGYGSSMDAFRVSDHRLHRCRLRRQHACGNPARRSDAGGG